MPQVSRFPLKEEVRARILSLFLEVLSQSKNKKRGQQFFEGFFTETEQIMFTKRLTGFFLLEKGILNKEIASLLKVSSATVSRFTLWQKSLTEEQRKMIRRVVFKKDLESLFVDLLKGIKYGSPLPPKHSNWSEWRKNKNEWEGDLENPLR